MPFAYSNFTVNILVPAIELYLDYWTRFIFYFQLPFILQITIFNVRINKFKYDEKGCDSVQIFLSLLNLTKLHLSLLLNYDVEKHHLKLVLIFLSQEQVYRSKIFCENIPNVNVLGLLTTYRKIGDRGISITVDCFQSQKFTYH